MKRLGRQNDHLICTIVLLKTGTAEGGGAGRAIILPLFFAWVDFLGLQMIWISYKDCEFYHVKVTKRVCSCICASRSQRLGRAALDCKTVVF